MTAVQSHAMSYGYVVFQNRLELSIRYVNDRIVLNIGIRAYPYIVHISTHGCVKPDAGVRTHNNISNYLRTVLDKSRFMDLRRLIQIGSNHQFLRKDKPVRSEERR